MTKSMGIVYHNFWKMSRGYLTIRSLSMFIINFVIEERTNLDPIFVEAKIFEKLHAVNNSFIAVI